MTDFWIFGKGESKRGGLFGGLFGKKAAAEKPSDTSSPALALFVTDGANDDRAAAERVLTEAQAHPVYWLLVGVGNPNEFGFLRDMADKLPNVGFVHLPNLEMTDDALYEELLGDEFVNWVKAR
jgi:hypothetical protein